MKIVINKNIYGWIMTGIIGKGGKWFAGYSRVPDLKKARAETLDQLTKLGQDMGEYE